LNELRKEYDENKASFSTIKEHYQIFLDDIQLNNMNFDNDLVLKFIKKWKDIISFQLTSLNKNRNNKKEKKEV